MGILQGLVFGFIFISSTLASANLVCTNIFTLDTAPTKKVETVVAKPQEADLDSINNLHFAGRRMQEATNKKEFNEALYILIESANRVMDDMVQIVIDIRRLNLTEQQSAPQLAIIDKLFSQLTSAFEVEPAMLSEAVVIRVKQFETEEALRLEARRARGPMGFIPPKQRKITREEMVQLQITEIFRKVLRERLEEPVEKGPLGFTGKKPEANEEVVERIRIGFRSGKVEVEEAPVKPGPIGFVPPKNGSSDKLEPTINIYLNPETGLFDFVRTFE